MNKAGIVDEVFKKAEGDLGSKAACERVVNAMLDAMHEAIVTEGRLQLLGLGSFSVGKRAARMGRNPQTGEPMQIKEQNTVRFKPGSALRAAVQD